MNTFKILCSGCGSELELINVSTKHHNITLMANPCSTCSDNNEDAERLDFLSEQKLTKWVGYHLDTKHGLAVTSVPVFYGEDLREAIDLCIYSKYAQLEKDKE